MATYDARVNSDGTTSHRIRWSEWRGRDALRPTFTFYDPRQAEDFKYLVERAGNKFPTDQELRAFGLDHLCASPAQIEEPEEEPPLTVAKYGELYLERLFESGPSREMNRRA